MATVCRARGLAPDRETRLILPVGCRTRVKGIPQGYMGNAIAGAVAKQPVGEILGDGRLGSTAWLLNRAVASVDEATVRAELASWSKNPSLRYAPDLRGDPAIVVLSGSPRFDVYGNDFGWGRPLGVRTGPGNKLDGLITVFEDGGGAGGMELEVCLAPHVLASLVADQQLMNPSV
uniref:Putative acetyltransferase n=2 Tax=Aegilops tauschii TaxID=37682 RepID=M8BRS1_AEGTA|nr:protein ENHANCED PSEUDOMONAS SUSCEPTIBILITY 1-like [Aegilops tauschii subsp. strangulata]